MTIEEILDCDPAKLEALPESELIKYFEPFFKVTRPELAEKPVSKGIVRKAGSPGFSSKLDQVRRMAAEMGLELDL